MAAIDFTIHDLESSVDRAIEKKCGGWERSSFGESKEIANVELNNKDIWCVFAEVGAHLTQAKILFKEEDNGLSFNFIAFFKNGFSERMKNLDDEKVAVRINNGEPTCVLYDIAKKMTICIDARYLRQSIEDFHTTKCDKFIFIGSKSSLRALILLKLFRKKIGRCVWIEPIGNDKLSVYGKIAKLLCDTVLVQSFDTQFVETEKVKNIGVLLRD